MLSVCPFVSEQTLTQDGPPPGAGLQAIHCVRCVPSGLAGNRGFFHAPWSLEVGGGMLVSFPAQSRAEKQKNKPWFNKNRTGKTESL